MVNLGCNKCEKYFLCKIGEKIFGGFDRSYWFVRNNDYYRKICGKIVKCLIKVEREVFEKKYGVCVFCLLDLDYFD